MNYKLSSIVRCKCGFSDKLVGSAYAQVIQSTKLIFYFRFYSLAFVRTLHKTAIRMLMLNDSHQSIETCQAVADVIVIPILHGEENRSQYILLRINRNRRSASCRSLCDKALGLFMFLLFFYTHIDSKYANAFHCIQITH